MSQREKTVPEGRGRERRRAVHCTCGYPMILRKVCSLSLAPGAAADGSVGRGRLVVPIYLSASENCKCIN